MRTNFRAKSGVQNTGNGISEFKNSNLSWETGSPFCARSRATVKFQNGSGPGVPFLIRAPSPPAPSTFEILPRLQPRSQALSSREGDNHGVAPVALFFADGQPGRQGWQISNISTLSYVSNPCLPNCLWSDFWLCGFYCDTEIMLSQSTSFIQDECTYSPRG